MGGFNAEHSDLDFIVVVGSALTPIEREKLSKEFLSIHGTSGFKKGIEMSIVEERYIGKNFVYPTPFEFHFGTEEQIANQAKPPKNVPSDPDLASYFVVIIERGVTVYGKEIRDAFSPPVPRKYYWKSVESDIKDVPKSIDKNPVYHILNLCRTYYGLRNNAIYSKIEGAEKYLSDLGSVSKEVVQKAYDAYSKNAEPNFDSTAVKEFGSIMLQKILPMLEKATAD